MLVFVEMQVTFGFLVLLAEHAVGRGELGHDQAAAAQVADEAAEDGVGDAGHGSQDCGWGNLNSADGEPHGNGLQWRCQSDRSVRPTRVVPGLAHCSILLGLSSESPRLPARASFQRYPWQRLVPCRLGLGLRWRVLGVLSAEALHT